MAQLLVNAPDMSVYTVSVKKHPNGEIAERTEYKNGVLSGKKLTWDSKGRLQSYERFTNGVKLPQPPQLTI